jgi:methionyl-tRNA formyltransferase
LIHWEADVRTIVSLVRGLSPTPCAFTFLQGKQLQVYAATAEATAVNAPPGTVIEVGRGGLRIAAGNGAVALQEVQWEGKKRLPVEDFLRGLRLAPGEVLGQ